MADVYALILPDSSLLLMRQKGPSWQLVTDLQPVEAGGRNLTVFVTGVDVLGVSATVPARSEAQARRAVPFAVEDELAEPVEASHVAIAPFNKASPEQPFAVNVASKIYMQSISAFLEDQGLGDARLVAAHSVLPDQNVLMEGPGIILGRLGPRTFTVDSSIGRDVLVGLSASHQDVVVLGSSLASALGRPSDGEGASSQQDLLARLADWSTRLAPGINLRQGEFAPRRSVNLDGAGRWRFAAGLAAMLALTWFGSVLLETYAMKQRAEGLRALTQDFVRAGWPETNGDVQQALALSRGLTGEDRVLFPSLLTGTGVLYEALGEVEGSELRSLRYDRLRRQMTATIGFRSFADMDQLVLGINNKGLLARAGDARQSGEKVVGDLTLEAAP